MNRGSGYKVSKCGLCRIFQILNWCLAIPALFVDLENRMKLTKYAWGWHTAHRVTDLARLGCLTRNLRVHHSFRQVGSTRRLLVARPGASTVRATAAAAQIWREARPNAPPLFLLHNNLRRGGSSLRIDLQRPPAQPTSEIPHPPSENDCPEASSVGC